MTVWQRHAERIRRQQEIARRRERIDRWIRWAEAHQWQASFLYIGFLVAVGEVALLLRYAIEWAAR